MYEQFYGFDRAPFANIPDPQSLFLSPSHRQALSILQYALISRAGFCVITGDIGAGKTTLVRRVLQTLDQTLEVGLVSNTQCESSKSCCAGFCSRLGSSIAARTRSRCTTS